VERVRGFSMEYHAIWHLYKPSTVAAPFWITMLTRDIRKLPPATTRRPTSGNATGAGSPATENTTASNGSSVIGTTDGTTTAVGTSRNPSMGYGDSPSEATAPPLRAFRKKRRRDFSEATQQPQAKYWSEYDHPEDGSDAGDAYVIYIDPNERSSFEVFFDKLARLFSRKPKHDDDDLLSTPSVVHDDDEESSSDEGARLLSRKPKTYGALPAFHTQPLRAYDQTCGQGADQSLLLPQFAALSLAASLVILIVAYLQAWCLPSLARWCLASLVSRRCGGSLMLGGSRGVLLEHCLASMLWAVLGCWRGYWVELFMNAVFLLLYAY
jgi:hypothetical protein